MRILPAPLLHVLQALDDPDVSIEESVHTVGETLLFLAGQVWRCDRRHASLEAAVGELVDLHLDPLFGVLRVQERRNLLLRGVAEGGEVGLRNRGHVADDG